MFRRNLGLDAAPGVPIFCNHDCAFYGDAQAIELLVVFRNAVIHEHQRRRHIAVDRVGVVRWQLFALLIRRRVTRDSRFLQLRDKFRSASYQLDCALFWRRIQNLESFDVCVQSKLLEFRRQPLSVVFVVWRSHVVRPRGKTLHVLTHQLRARNSLEFFFPLALRVRRLRGESRENRLVAGRRWQPRQRRRNSE